MNRFEEGEVVFYGDKNYVVFEVKKTRKGFIYKLSNGRYIAEEKLDEEKV